MNEDVKKLVSMVMDAAMTGENRASVLAYAKGRLAAQRQAEALPASVEGAEQQVEKGGER